LPGNRGGGKPTTVFSTALTLSHVLGVNYVLHVYTYNLHHNFACFATVEKFNPQLIFHNNSTTANNTTLSINTSALDTASAAVSVRLWFLPVKWLKRTVS